MYFLEFKLCGEKENLVTINVAQVAQVSQSQLDGKEITYLQFTGGGFTHVAMPYRDFMARIKEVGEVSE